MLVVAAVLALSACQSEPPTTPHYTDHFGTPPPQVACEPGVAVLTCSLRDWHVSGRRGAWVDVTSDAEWSTSDPTVGAVVSPGVVTPLRRGTVTVEARYQAMVLRSLYGYSYLLEPNAPTVKLGTLWGTVYEDDGKQTTSAEALGEIVSGTHNTGRSARTLPTNGAFSLSDFWMAEPFSVRASKAGYQAVTIDHPGVDDSHHTQFFYLKRLPPQ